MCVSVRKQASVFILRLLNFSLCARVRVPFCVCLQLYSLFNVCTVDLCVCLMLHSYSSTFQNDSETPEGIYLELMDRLLKKGERVKERMEG